MSAITGWLSGEDCPDCGGPLLDTSDSDRLRSWPARAAATPPPGTPPTPPTPAPTPTPWRMSDTTRDRAQRLAMPLARDVVRDLAAEHGGCIRPVQLRRTDLDTGHVDQVLIPCGHTLATVCPACADRAKTLRAAQCRDGWHLTPNPSSPPTRPTTAAHVDRAPRRRPAAARPGPRRRTGRPAGAGRAGRRAGRGDRPLRHPRQRPAKRTNRRHRSTRRRQDAPDLPRRPVEPRTIGKIYTAADGTTYRPSMFLTLTCDSYGRVTR